MQRRRPRRRLGFRLVTQELGLGSRVACPVRRSSAAGGVEEEEGEQDAKKAVKEASKDEKNAIKKRNRLLKVQSCPS